MATNRALIPAVLMAMMLSIAFSIGTAAAAQSSIQIQASNANVRMISSYNANSNFDVPYDETNYRFDLHSLQGDFAYNHKFDAANVDFEAESLEVENQLACRPAPRLKSSFVSEELSKTKIDRGAENASLCYYAATNTRIAANALNFESASIIDSANLAYATSTEGIGKMQIQGIERNIQGDVNGSWIEYEQIDSAAVRYGYFNVSSSFQSEIPADFPAEPAAECLLCPFAAP
ncbi:hypothetical protein DRN97_04430 [Methanosarcinales archaeon]|nr:MAG: hypothetical protein DRN97_04430 [Methanosarcinales archaeon]